VAYLARVHVSLKPAVNDPQGITIARALKTLGFEGVQSVRAGKYLEVRLAEDDRDAAEARVREMCQKLLANPVTETFSFDLEKL
jgi:phosphoribosylformylglycinamidine synthase